VPPAQPDQSSPAEIIMNLREEWAQSSTPPTVADVWECAGVGGRARLVARGALMTGPPDIDRRFTICAYSSILIPVIYFYLVCGVFLWHFHAWLLYCSFGFAALTAGFLFLTAFTDPGIIPRPALQLMVPGLQEEVAAAMGLTGKPGGRKEDLLLMGPTNPIMLDLEPHGFWWCKYCHMIQPPRAKHCKDCNCCILREDHHCPFLNNCIGLRNYGFFYGFVVSLCFLAGSFVVGVSLWLRDGPCSSLGFGTCVTHKPGIAILYVLAWPLVVIVGLLLLAVSLFALWHLWLIIRGRTTREVLTGRSQGEGVRTLCARRSRSLIRGKDKIVFPDLQNGV